MTDERGIDINPQRRSIVLGACVQRLPVDPPPATPDHCAAVVGENYLGGIEAVRIRIAAALDPLHDRIPRLTIEAGQVALQTAIDDFYTKLLLSESG